MRDSRGQHILDALSAARGELGGYPPDTKRVVELLTGAKGIVLDIVDEGMSKTLSLRSLNELDAARQLLNRAIDIAPTRWEFADQFTAHASTHVCLALGVESNVVPLRRDTGGGAA